MGKVSKTNVDNLGSSPHLSTKKRKRRSRKSRCSLTKEYKNIRKTTMSLRSSTKVIEKSNKKMNSSIKQTKIKDNSTEIINNDLLNITATIVIEDDSTIETVPSTITASNVENCYVIDITDTTVDDDDENDKKIKTLPSKTTVSNIENNDIIDITDEKDSKTIKHRPISSNNDVQFISCSTNAKQNQIELITISDSSDEENIPLEKHVNEPIEYKSMKKHSEVSNHYTNTRKRKYNSPLYNRKRTKIDENALKYVLPNNLVGSFIIDKNQMDLCSQNFQNDEYETTAFSHQHKPSSNIASIANKKLRPIIIDGLNIGHAHGGPGIFSAKGIDLCINYFISRGHTDITAFIPQHRQGPPGSESNNILNQLVKRGHICFTPSRKVQNLRMTCYDDRIMLDYAHRCGGVVVSNDNYRDLYNENDAFKDIIENRHVMVTFVRNEIIVPEDQYNRRFNVRCLSDILCFPEYV